MLIQRIRDLGQPHLVLDQFQQFLRGKNLMPLYAGLPDGLSSRAPTRIGTSCGWQLITQAARFAVSFLCSCLLRLFLRRHFTQHPAHGGGLLK